MSTFLVQLERHSIMKYRKRTGTFTCLAKNHAPSAKNGLSLLDARGVPGSDSPGNSHSRGFLPLLAIPDAPPACFRHWRQQASVPLARHSLPGGFSSPMFYTITKNHPFGWFFIMVEHRGVSSRGSTPLGQGRSEATLWPHSLRPQVLLPYVLYHNKKPPIWVVLCYGGA